MQQGFTPSLKTQILKYFFFDTPQEVDEPTPLFLGLFIDQGSAEPQELVIGRNGYNRAPVVFHTEEDSGVIKNMGAVTFPKATANWTNGTEKITYVGVFKSHEVFDEDDAYFNEESGSEPTGKYISDESDEMIACILLPEPETVLGGETFQFNSNSITLQLI